MKQWIRIISSGFILFLVVFIGAMGFLYPFQGDDFMFLAALHDNGITGYISRAYLTWTLRLGDVFTLLCLTCGKTAFNLLNPVMQLLLAVMLFRFGFRRFPRKSEAADCLGLALLFAMSAVLVARPRDTVFWMTGSCVYAWGLTLWFGFWGEVLRHQDEKRGAWYAAGMTIAGIAAALILENVMPVGLLLGAWIIFRRCRAKRPLNHWLLASLSGYAAGALLFLIAPGRWQRMQMAAGNLTLWDRLRKIAEVAIFWAGSAWPAFLLWGICLVLLLFANRKRLRQEMPAQLKLLLLSALSCGAFAATGLTPAMRGYLFSALLIALAAIRLVSLLVHCGGRIRCGIGILTGALLLGCCGITLLSVPQFIRIEWDESLRMQQVAERIDQDPVVVPEHSTLRKHFLQYIWIEDFTDDAGNPANRHAALYYRVPAIRIDCKTEIPLYWKGKK